MREIRSAVITGPSGVIGTALCRLLTEKGIKVFAVTRPGSARAEHLRQIKGVELVERDAAALSALPEKLSGGADAFFHFAWAKTVGAGRNDMPSQIKNIQYTIDAARAAAALGCRVFVGAGSQAEYGRVDVALRPDTPCFPENGYGMAKLCAGQMSRAECERLGVEHVWPRILSVYGPYDNMSSMVMGTIDKLLRGEKPALTAGGQLWDFLYGDDAAEALWRMAVYGKHGAVYPLGSGEAPPLRKSIETIRDLIDPALPLGFGEIPYGDKQVMYLQADISTLRSDLAFVPRVDFRTGIQKTTVYIRSQYHG